MNNLSYDIEESIKIVLEGLSFDVIISDVDPEKMTRAMKSKEDSFLEAKALMNDWMNSANRPSDEKAMMYAKQLVLAGDGSIIKLRKSLTAKIDYASLPAEKHGMAIKAKTIILKAIRNINASLVELRIQISENSLRFKEDNYKVGYAERFANQEFYPKVNYFKQWHNKEEDAVMICPFGTKGEIIEIEGLKIQLPKVPAKKHILFSKEPASDQYWRREGLPKGLTPDSSDSFASYILEQFRKRREGVWFMNNGKAVYLPGVFWYTLEHGKMLDNGEYMLFKEAQLKIAYHQEACFRDPRSLGELFVKSRRTGFTYMVLFRLLEESTSTKNGRYGMTSKSNDDVEEAFKKFSYAFMELPFFFQPVVKGKTESTKKLYFGKPPDTSADAKRKKQTSTNDYLNTEIDTRPTKNDAYDSSKLNGYLGDECFSIGTKILMDDLSFKNIEDINIGDKVTNGNGKIVEVARTVSGYDDMYTISQPYGKDYLVNKSHRLLLDNGNSIARTKKITITPLEYLKKSEYYRKMSRRVTFKGVEYPEVDLPIDPYIFGLWLGDGYSVGGVFVVNKEKDVEIYDELVSYCKANNFQYKEKERDGCINFTIIDKDSHGSNQHSGIRHRFKKNLEDMNVLNNKHIPEIYKKSSIRQRIEMLSGLIDSDGYKADDNIISIGMSRKYLIKDIYNVVNTCGLECSNIFDKKSNYNTDVYYISFIDYNSILNCRVDRKKTIKTKEVNRRGSMNVQYFGIGEFYGITLKTENDDDRVLVLEDYTLSMNCGKWARPVNYIEHFGTIKPAMMPGGRVVGKAWLGSTVGALNKGGEEFRTMDKMANVSERVELTGKTANGLYAFFLPAYENQEICTDKYGKCWQETPPEGTLDNYGIEIKFGTKQYLQVMADEAKKSGENVLNAHYRAEPSTREQAYRDKSDDCMFNINKLYEQLDYNNSKDAETLYTVGNFAWKDGIRDTEVIFTPNKNGRFKLAWLPSMVDGTKHIMNNVTARGNKFYPNNDFGFLSSDPFSVRSASGGRGSSGAIHGFCSTSIGNLEKGDCFLQYLCRAKTEDIFFEDVVMAMHFFGIKILAELNRVDLLRYIRNRGYRPFSEERLDKHRNKLTPHEEEYGGQQMSGESILDNHLSAINSYIDYYVGVAGKNNPFRPEGEMGKFPFNETLEDWKIFDPSDRTKHDASISSGLGIMAINKEKYKPKKASSVDLNINDIFPTFKI